jgi:hypothetical protein
MTTRLEAAQRARETATKVVTAKAKTIHVSEG